MGMATVAERKTPKARYKNTIVCEHCYAEYNPNLHWTKGFTVGTTDEFIPLMDIGKNKCPICRKPSKSS